MLSSLLTLLIRLVAIALSGWLACKLLKAKARQPTFATVCGVLLAGLLPLGVFESSRLSTLENPNQAQIDGQTLAGEAFQMADLRGKVVLVDFWATWCPPCVASIPDLKELYATYQPLGLEIIGVSLDRQRSHLQNFVVQNDVPWTQIVPSETPGANGFAGSNAVRYEVASIPYTLLVDQSGIIIARGLRGASIEAGVARALDQPVSAWLSLKSFTWKVIMALSNGLLQVPIWLLASCVFGCNLIGAKIRNPGSS